MTSAFTREKGIKEATLMRRKWRARARREKPVPEMGLWAVLSCGNLLQLVLCEGGVGKAGTKCGLS